MCAARRDGPAPRKAAARRKTARLSRAPARNAIAIKRVYDAPGSGDGLRILVDRLWPRGRSKAELKLDAWPRQLAPSSPLRRWYGHDAQRWEQFRERYLDELEQKRDDLAQLRATLRGRKATLLTATRDLALSHAQILRQALRRGARRKA